ncbi:alpha/beta hydrolase [Roseivivax sp. CAU 1761]
MLRALLGLLLLAALAAALWALLGRPAPVPAPRFDAARLEGGVAAYLEAREARFDDIVPGTEKRVIWAGAPEARAPWAVVYLHGFSASSEEVRPLPDRVAAALGANLVFTRLAGHGRGGAAMAEATLEAWMADVAEALAVGRRVGERVLVMATSTGATLATLAAADPALSRDVAGMVLLSPNYRPRARAARLLNWPLARHWVPLLAGRERGFAPVNAAQARYWTTRYPVVATIPMAEAVAAARRLDPGRMAVPTLFLAAPGDTVVDPEAARAMAARWGGPAEFVEVEVPPGNAPARHVIAGDIVAPDMTAPLAERIVDWTGRLGAEVTTR